MSSVGQAVLEEQKQQWLGDGSALHPRDYSEATAREVDLAVREMLDEAYLAATDLLGAHMSDLKAGTRLLLEHETITPDDFPPLQRGQVPVVLSGKAKVTPVAEAVGHGG